MKKLIYADDISRRLENVIQFGAKADDGEHPISAECVLSVLESLPTVDAVPVKRGYWKMVTMSEATGYDPGLSGNDPLYGHVCSVCKHEARLNEEEEEILSNFCPDCGAVLIEKGGAVLKKLIELGASIDAAICAADEYDGGYNFERDRKIRDALMALPTIDAVQVRHGHCVKWYEEVHDSFGVGYTPHYKCSECDTEYDQYDAMRMNYCPNCGVRLIEDIDGRGEQHER